MVPTVAMPGDWDCETQGHKAGKQKMRVSFEFGSLPYKEIATSFSGLCDFAFSHHDFHTSTTFLKRLA
jgi:hypothetical protein